MQKEKNITTLFDFEKSRIIQIDIALLVFLVVFNSLLIFGIYFSEIIHNNLFFILISILDIVFVGQPMVFVIQMMIFYANQKKNITKEDLIHFYFFSFSKSMRDFDNFINRFIICICGIITSILVINWVYCFFISFRGGFSWNGFTRNFSTFYPELKPFYYILLVIDYLLFSFFVLSNSGVSYLMVTYQLSVKDAKKIFFMYRKEALKKYFPTYKKSLIIYGIAFCFVFEISVLFFSSYHLSFYLHGAICITISFLATYIFMSRIFLFSSSALLRILDDKITPNK